MLLVHEPPFERTGQAPGLATFLAGIHFIRRTPVMLGAITLDLFAVLFGGAIALLPLFAREILHTGPARARRPAERPGRRRAASPASC